MGQRGFDVGAGNNIKSIQRGSNSIANASTSLSIPINDVDLNKAVIIVNCTGGSSSLDSSTINAHFTSVNRIQVIRWGSTDVVTFDWWVIEFNNVKSVQSGVILTSGTTDNIQNINRVEISKSLLICSWRINSTNTTYATTLLKYFLTNETTITFKSFTAHSKEVRWQLIEFE